MNEEDTRFVEALEEFAGLTYKIPPEMYKSPTPPPPLPLPRVEIDTTMEAIRENLGLDLGERDPGKPKDRNFYKKTKNLNFDSSSAYSCNIAAIPKRNSCLLLKVPQDMYS